VASQVEEAEVLVLEYGPPIENWAVVYDAYASGVGRGRKVRLDIGSFTSDLEHDVRGEEERWKHGSGINGLVMTAVSGNFGGRTGRVHREHLVALQELFTSQFIVTVSHEVLFWIHEFRKNVWSRADAVGCNLGDYAGGIPAANEAAVSGGLIAWSLFFLVIGDLGFVVIDLELDRLRLVFEQTVLGLGRLLVKDADT